MGAGNVIFLNGSSSAGKTTIAGMLQQILDEPYQHIALDQFRDGMPGRFRGLNSPDGTPGALGLNVVPIQREGQRVTQIRFGSHGSHPRAWFGNRGWMLLLEHPLRRPMRSDGGRRGSPFEPQSGVAVGMSFENARPGSGPIAEQPI